MRSSDTGESSFSAKEHSETMRFTVYVDVCEVVTLVRGEPLAKCDKAEMHWCIPMALVMHSELVM